MELLKRFMIISFVLNMGLLSFLCSSSQAYDFYVGGRDGWVLNPSENFNHWAERNRFQVNDTLIFKFKKGSDSVLVVSKEDYDKCETTKPIMRLEGGDLQKLKFDRSGPFFFISGVKSNCEKGQKLIVVVLAVRHHPPPPPTMSPPPSATVPSLPPAKTPVIPAASPSGTTSSPPSGGDHHDHHHAPAPAPSSSPSIITSSSTGLVIVVSSVLSTLVLGRFVGSFY